MAQICPLVVVRDSYRGPHKYLERRGREKSGESQNLEKKKKQ